MIEDYRCCTETKKFPSLHEARAAAHASGWTTREADDYCPTCTDTERSEQ